MAVKHRIRICIGYNQDGSPILKQLGANSEAELGDMAVRAILASERKGEFIHDAPSKIICLPDAKENAAPLLGDYAWTWFRTYKAQNIKPTTANFYNLLLRNICQGLGDKPVDEITTADIQGFLNANDGKARSYVNQMRRLIRVVLQSALEDGLISRNPGDSKRITISSTKKQERQPLCAEQVFQIVQGLPELALNDRRYMALLLFTGMRKGEVLGLQWEDIDPKAMEIHVQRSVTFPGGANDPHIGTPKSEKSARIIPMAKELLALLEPLEPSGFVIGEGEKPLTKIAERRMLQRVERKIDLYGATPHIFRHTYATLLSASGAAPKTIQAILGHADISTTMNRYVHQDAGLIHQAAETVSQAIVRAR